MLFPERMIHMRNESEIITAVYKHGDTVKRVCTIHLKNHMDTEDIFQEVFLKYMLSKKEFENETHEKAWLLRVAINACKDYRKNFFRSKCMPLEELMETADEIGLRNRELLMAVLGLPRKYRQVIYLHYYEGYSPDEIGWILHRNVNTVYTHLTRGRQCLRAELEKK